MTKRETLEQELKGLKQALQEKTISVNEYCSFYHSTWQKLKNLPLA